MPFLVNDAYLPATLTGQPMTDEEFSAFCAEHPDLNFEMSADGELIVMPPLIPIPAPATPKIAGELHNWRGRAAAASVAIPQPGLYFPTAPAVRPMLRGR